MAPNGITSAETDVKHKIPRWPFVCGGMLVGILTTGTTFYHTATAEYVNMGGMLIWILLCGTLIAFGLVAGMVVHILVYLMVNWDIKTKDRMMNNNQIRELSWVSPIICLAWAWLYWYLLFYGILWGVFRVGLGAILPFYGFIFSVPVLFGNMVYQIIVNRIYRNQNISSKKRLVYELIIPLTVTTFLLTVLCPCDGGLFIVWIFR